MKSRTSFPGTGQKTQHKHSPFPPSKSEKKQIFLNLTERGKSSGVARGSVVQVSTVMEEAREHIRSGCVAAHPVWT